MKFKNTKTIDKTNDLKGLFENINKIYKLLVRMTKKTEDTNYHYQE